MKAKAATFGKPLLFGLLGLVAVAGAAFFVAARTGTDFLSHSAFDSYTLQAMTWRNGAIALEKDYPWLELAIFEGRYYVSFPPVPTLPMWLLSFFFGDVTPSALVTLLYLLGGYVAGYILFSRHISRWQAALFAAFTALGGSLLDIAISGGGFGGGVWFQAQTLAYCLTMLSFCLLDGRRPAGWAAGLIAIALSVGCRPLNALYVPFLLYRLYGHVKGNTLRTTLLAMLPYVVIPGLIACALGAYNLARFGNPLEFGHSYLPEFTRSGEPMLSPRYILANILNILRPPALAEGRLSFPIISGFAVYLTQPLLLFALYGFTRRAMKGQREGVDILLLSLCALHFLTLLTHRTNGGWQYGTRYLCDMVPALSYLYIRGKKPIRLLAILAMGAFTLFNLYGTILFHTMG